MDSDTLKSAFCSEFVSLAKSSVFLRGSCALALVVCGRQNMLRRSSGVESDGTNLTDASGFEASTADQTHVACDDDYLSIDDDAPSVPITLPQAASVRPLPIHSSPQDKLARSRAEADAMLQQQPVPALPKKRFSPQASSTPLHSRAASLLSSSLAAAGSRSPAARRSSSLTQSNLEAHILSSSPTQQPLPPKPESATTGSVCDECHFRQANQKRGTHRSPNKSDTPSKCALETLMICQLLPL